jgi:ABC-type antimicrobial peptide transport system ATPase subunit
MTIKDVKPNDFFEVKHHKRWGLYFVLCDGAVYKVLGAEAVIEEPEVYFDDAPVQIMHWTLDQQLFMLRNIVNQLTEYTELI